MASEAPAIDLRSDTVTRPTAGMRRAMAEAEVGDDVYGEDPTVRALQERVADLLGTEAALLVPSGTMANQIALRAHTRPGDEVLIGKDAHCWLFESGALAALAGAQTQVLPGDGRFTAAAVRAGFKPDDPYLAPTRVVAVENTHNMGGGVCWDPAALAEVTDTAHALGMATHLDGARLWNAAVAGATTERALARGFDSISVCLSKGLGAPIGSVVAGGRDLVQRCHRFRKMYGGGMRQAGVIAAAGLYALDHHRPRLGEDHAKARDLATRLHGAPGLRVDLAAVDTNVVMIDLDQPIAGAVVAAARRHGLRLGTIHERRLRAVTHLDVDAAQMAPAATALARAVAEASAGAAG
jgi:threonine aldolase